jgi:DNA-binding beta-propeller fold protein YncE
MQAAFIAAHAVHASAPPQFPSAAVLDAQHGHLLLATVAGGIQSTSTVPGTVRIYSTATGALLRTVTVGVAPLHLLVADHANRLLVVNRGPDISGAAASLTLLNAATGSVLKTVPLSHLPAFLTVADRTDRLISVIPAAGSSQRGAVEMRDAVTGTTVISTTVGINPGLALADPATGRVFVGNGGYSAQDPQATCTLPVCEPTVSILDAHSGKLLATRLLGAPTPVSIPYQPPSCGPVLYQLPTGIIAVTGRGTYQPAGALQMLDPRTGAVRRSLPYASQSCALGVDTRLNRALLLPLPGDVSGAALLDLSTGTILRTVPTGLNPFGLTIDSTTNTGFIVDVGELSGGQADVRVIDMATGATRRTILRRYGPAGLLLDEQAGRVYAFVHAVTSPGLPPTNNQILVLDAATGLTIRRWAI